MPSTLCFDFGNTRLKCAVFSGKKFLKEIVLENDDEKTIEEIIQEYKPQKSILFLPQYQQYGNCYFWELRKICND